MENYVCRPVIPAEVEEVEFELLDNVEWGPRPDDEGYDTDQELVPRPNKMRSREACNCPFHRGSCSDLSCILFACNEECSARNCPAGIFCGNQRIQKRQFKAVEVFDAGLKGRGLKTLDPIKKGDIVVEYTGRAVKENKLKQLFRRYQFDRRLYILSLGFGVYLDARQKGGLSRYINHSCQPNCRVERWTVKGILRAVVVAVCDIPSGAELSFDYQWERKKGRAPTKCHCGSIECRGTLEVKKSLEESNLEEQLQGHWEHYSSTATTLDHTIINRFIQVKDQATDDFFLGEITGYDPQTGQHSVLYRQDMSEAWEDLAKEEWKVLNATIDENFMISKKKQKLTHIHSDAKRLLGSQQPIDGPGVPRLVKHYVFVQTPIKCALYGRHLVDLCQSKFSVQVTCQQLFHKPYSSLHRQSLDDAEDQERNALLNASQDGTVWKLSITGVDLESARTFIEQQAGLIERKIEMETSMALKQAAVLATAKAPCYPSVNDPKTYSDGLTHTSNVSEIIFPRLISDAVKRKLQSLREKCKSVTIFVAPSYSKSKLFTRLLLEGSEEMLLPAQQILWNALTALCVEENVPTVNNLPVNLGIMGGILSQEHFDLLVYSHGNNKSHFISFQESRSLSVDATEELRQRSTFFASFENAQQCTVWVQADDDKNSINGSNKAVESFNVHKIFLGCVPNDVPRLWSYIQSRILELQRGVKFLHLDHDRFYQIILNNSQVFDFVKKVSGASVNVDAMTRDHLCIDGRTVEVACEIDPTEEQDRASLAEEMIRLQIEIYRDHFTREQFWLFGRDWGHVVRNINPNPLVSSTSVGKYVSSFGQLDSKSSSQGAFEIAEVVANLGLQGNVGAHAAIIMYRFVSVKTTLSDIKFREGLLACVYLANKCQKCVKWKKLETVLEAGYEAFYPETKFNSVSEEVLVLEERVITAESEILSALNFDVFWHGFDGIESLAIEIGRMTNKNVSRVFEFACSGPVLGCGPELWLAYGVEYIFTASAALLNVSIESLIPALGLTTLRVSQAASLLVESAKYGRPTGINAKYPSILVTENGRIELRARILRIEEDCITLMGKAAGANVLSPRSSMTALALDQRYKIITDRSRKFYCIAGVPLTVLRNNIISTISRVEAATSCSIFLRLSESLTSADVILDGFWKAIALADYLLRRSMPPEISLPTALDATQEFSGRNTLQAKAEAGRMNSNELITSSGWDGTHQPESFTNKICKSRIGGRCCIAGKVSEDTLRTSGLRWWITPAYGSSLSGSVNDMVLVQLAEHCRIVSVLKDVAAVVLGKSPLFPKLTDSGPSNEDSHGKYDRYKAISLQQWPSDKVYAKESRVSSKSKGRASKMGFSAAALQEMQLLTHLHSLISTPFGHPNFILPIGIAIPSDVNVGIVDKVNNGSTNPKKVNLKLEMVEEDPIYSLFRTSTENEKASDQAKSVNDRPHLVFQATPFVMQSFLSKNMKKRLSNDLRSYPALLASWFHDLLSALVHCHSNHVVMRNIQVDQIVVDHCGTAKFGGLYRCSVLSAEDLSDSAPSAAYKAAKESLLKKMKKRDEEVEDVSKNVFLAPELLLGSPKHGKETDVWAMGCLLATLLLGKSLFVAKYLKNRQDLLTSQYKIVGSPSKDNWMYGTKFPHFVKPLKRYRRGVEKALERMLKSDISLNDKKAIDMIAQMLHLDPSERITAEKALSHDYMVEYLEQSTNNPFFRDQYVQEWVSLKEQMLNVTDSEQEEQRMEDKNRMRKAMLVEATRFASDEDEDELYTMDEIVGLQSHKKLD